MDGFVLFGILAVLLLVLASRGRAGPRGRLWMRLRVLLPAWRFFDAMGPALTLHYRTAAADTALGAYRPLPLRAPRRPWSIVLNPAGNMQLAYHTILEQLVNEASELVSDESCEVEQLVPYALTLNLVRAHLPAEARHAGGSVQFKLTLTEAHASEDVLVSRIHDT